MPYRTKVNGSLMAAPVSLPAESEQPERALALSYAPASARAALTALLRLDDALALLLRTTREPAVGQIRLAWWREALERLDHAPAPAEPTLQALQREVLRHGVSGASLVPVVHGWEVLIEAQTLDTDALRRFGEGRGTLFQAGATALGSHDEVTQAGQGWALADLSRNLDNASEAAEARRMAQELLAPVFDRRWTRNGRALGALALLARMDLAMPADTPVPVGAPRRVGRLFWHRLTGR